MSSKLLLHRAALCNTVRRIALEAGEITLEYFDEAGYEGADAKEDGSPVTLADQEAEKLIQKRLEDMLPGIPMIGEEAAPQDTNPTLRATIISGWSIRWTAPRNSYPAAVITL